MKIGIIVISCLCLLLLAVVFLRSSPVPKIIWVYWDSEELPPLIERIKTYNRGALKGWSVRFLNRQSLATYISADAFPAGYNALSVQHQSDWIRLYLLSRYGGCWLDAAIVLNDPEAMNRMWSESVARRSVFTGFATGPKTYVHPSGVRMPLVVDNWCIMAPPGSEVIRRWFREYEEAIRVGFLNYKRGAIRDGVDISAIRFKEGANDVYLTQHICLQKVFQKDLLALPSMLLLHSKDSMFKLQIDCKWNEECFRRAFLSPEAKRLPYIKLIGANRDTSLLGYFS